MLTPELKKLKEQLEQDIQVRINKAKLLAELRKLDDSDMKPLFESLSMSTGVCPACGRKL